MLSAYCVLRVYYTVPAPNKINGLIVTESEALEARKITIPSNSGWLAPKSSIASPQTIYNTFFYFFNQFGYILNLADYKYDALSSDTPGERMAFCPSLNGSKSRSGRFYYRSY